MKEIRDLFHLPQWEIFKEAGARVGLHFCGLTIFESPMNTVKQKFYIFQNIFKISKFNI